MLLLSLLLLLPLPLLTIQFCDLLRRGTIAQFLGGNTGFYALDCARAASWDNPQQLFADYTDAGRLWGMVVGMRLGTQDAGYTSGYIDHVELQEGTELLRYFVQTLGDRYTFVWKKAGVEAIRLYQFEDTAKHARYVINGRVSNTAIATPVYHHCLRSLLAPGQEW